MFINTGGLPEQHTPHRGDKLHLQSQRHHHGTRDLQQFGQLHHPYRSRCLAARRYLLLPDSRRHGSLSPAALLLKLGPHSLFLSASTLLLTSHLITPPSPASRLSPSLHRDHKTNMDGLHNLLILLK